MFYVNKSAIVLAINYCKASVLVINDKYCCITWQRFLHHEEHEDTRSFYKIIILRDLRGCTKYDFSSPDLSRLGNKALIMTENPINSQKCINAISENPIPGLTAFKNRFISIWPYRIIRMLLAAIFLWSGVAKLLAPAPFAVIIEAFGLIPESWVMPVTVVLPTLEVIAAVGLLLDIRGSLAIVFGMLVLFMAILLYGIQLGLDIDCGCFGPQDPESEAFHSLRPALYRDFVMMAGVIYLYIWRYFRSVKPIRLMYFFKNLFHRGGMIDAHD